MYIKLNNGVIEKYPYTIADLKNDNPNTCFPSTITNELLADWDVFPVVPTPQPEYDVANQNCNEGTPVLVDKTWLQTWIITEKTEEEKLQYKEQTAAQNKQTAESLLQQTDWTCTVDITNPQYSNPYLMNQDAFLVYRSTVRAIAVNPPTTPATFPGKPQEIWSS